MASAELIATKLISISFLTLSGKDSQPYCCALVSTLPIMLALYMPDAFKYLLSVLKIMLA